MGLKASWQESVPLWFNSPRIAGFGLRESRGLSSLTRRCGVRASGERSRPPPVEAWSRRPGARGTAFLAEWGQAQSLLPSCPGGRGPAPGGQEAWQGRNTASRGWRGWGPTWVGAGDIVTVLELPRRLHPGGVVGGTVHPWTGVGGVPGPGWSLRVNQHSCPFVGLFAQVPRVARTGVKVREPTQELFVGFSKDLGMSLN